jgi:glycoprotein-N-acetylgalactosamine 3-beta-galactosyltransferase
MTTGEIIFLKKKVFTNFNFSYIIVENLRYMLSQYNPKTSLFFGHRYAVHVDEGYMAGGGYVLSKKALKKFSEKLIYNATVCDSNLTTFAEDLQLGRCLVHSAIFVDCRDEFQQKRFFPVSVTEHLKPKSEINPNFWYVKNQYHESQQGSLSCCSDVPIAFHYIAPKEMYLFEYLIYRVHPFGLEKNLTKTLPRKLKLEEIIEASDVKSLSPNFVNHTDYHQLDSDEKYD